MAGRQGTPAARRRLATGIITFVVSAGLLPMHSAAASPGTGAVPVVSGPAGSASDAQGGWQDDGDWQRVWQDDFNGPAGSGVDASAWKYNTGQGVFGTGEIETMTDSPQNVHLDGHGNLDITALGHGRSWTSGRIQTQSSDFGAPAGGEMAVTSTIRQPDPANGLGYWPAFWMLGPGDWPSSGEIDVLEDVDALSQHSATFHCGNLDDLNPDGTRGPCHEFTGLSSGLLSCPGCQTGFHTYTAVVDRRKPGSEQIRWYKDDKEFFHVDESQVPQATWSAAVDHGYSIIFDLAIGGGYPDAVCNCTSPDDKTTSGGTMTVRDVAVYTLPARNRP